MISGLKLKYLRYIPVNITFKRVKVCRAGVNMYLSPSSQINIYSDQDTVYFIENPPHCLHPYYLPPLLSLDYLYLIIEDTRITKDVIFLEILQ